MILTWNMTYKLHLIDWIKLAIFQNVHRYSLWLLFHFIFPFRSLVMERTRCAHIKYCGFCIKTFVSLSLFSPLFILWIVNEERKKREQMSASRVFTRIMGYIYVWFGRNSEPHCMHDDDNPFFSIQLCITCFSSWEFRLTFNVDGGNEKEHDNRNGTLSNLFLLYSCLERSLLTLDSMDSRF